jgi:DNA polymerase III alpha subunit
MDCLFVGQHIIELSSRGVVFLAKNKEGYHNLAKMSSIAYVDGFYYVPRIDKTVISQYKTGFSFARRRVI